VSCHCCCKGCGSVSNAVVPPFLSVLLSLFDQILHFLHEALVFLVCSSKVTVGFSISLSSNEWVDWCYVDFLEHMVFTWRTLSFRLTVAFLITCLQWEVSWRNWQVCRRSLHFACAFSVTSVNQGDRVMLAFLWKKMSAGFLRKLWMDFCKIWAVALLWNSEAGMACLQVKLCVAIPERCKKCIGIQRRFTNVQVYFYFFISSWDFVAQN